MIRLWQQIIKGEKGQALPVVLILLVLGGLLIIPSLNYASTSLNAGKIVKQNMRGVYAADAGVEYVLWQITNGIDEPDEELPENENVNELQVTMETEDKGIYALYFGELLEITEIHYDWLGVEGEMQDMGGGTYQYTITVIWQPYPGEPDILVDDIGVRLPIGYSYQPGSAAGFPGNLFVDDPWDLDVTDWAGAQMLSWELEPPYPDPRPEVTIDNPTATQTFYVTGEGDQGGDYTWVKGAEGRAIGEVGDVTGTLYSITATARRPGDGDTMAKVRADVILYEDEGAAETHIILWQINPAQE